MINKRINYSLIIITFILGCTNINVSRFVYLKQNNLSNDSCLYNVYRGDLSIISYIEQLNDENNTLRIRLNIKKKKEQKLESLNVNLYQGIYTFKSQNICLLDNENNVLKCLPAFDKFLTDSLFKIINSDNATTQTIQFEFINLKLNKELTIFLNVGFIEQNSLKISSDSSLYFPKKIKREVPVKFH